MLVEMSQSTQRKALLTNTVSSLTLIKDLSISSTKSANWRIFYELSNNEHSKFHKE